MKDKVQVRKIREKISMKWKVFLYFLGFTAILLGILWTVQIVYLDTIYKVIKEKKLNKVADYVQEQVETKDLEYVIASLSRDYDMNINIMDNEGNSVVQSTDGAGESAFSMNYEQFKYYYGEAVKAGGRLDVFTEKKQDFPKPEIIPDEEETIRNKRDGKNSPFGEKIRQMEHMLSVRVVDTEGGEYVIMVEALLSPVDATVDTLRTQLVVISIIMMILSFGIAILLSKSLTKSIVRINKAAKKLGNGDFQVEFDGKDYREIAELSETLNQTAKDLAKVEGLQRELIANVSHDLRTPLTMIIAYSEVMRDIPGENTAENVQVVIEEAERLTNLVNDMLDVSKLQAGAVKTELERFDLTASVERVMERYEKLMEQEGYNISFSYAEHVFVKADEFKLSQVLYNLINNAINYTGEDKKVEVIQTVEDEWVKIEVKDTGEGISAEDLPNVWERYYKVDKNHKRAVSGSGLGLSIVKNILKLHEADYGVDSTPGEGSTFWFRLKRND